jgi:glycosyltransferase involved in cell wall biosynthesis
MNQEPQVAVAHLGSRWNYDIPVMLEKMDLLTHFYTDAYCGKGSWLEPLAHLPPALLNTSLQRLRARSRPELSAHKITPFNFLGIEYNWRYSRVQNTSDRLRLFLEINQRFNHLILTQGLPPPTNILFSMNTASLELFQNLKTPHKLLDQNLLPMQIESALLQQEYDRWKNWSLDEDHSDTSQPILQQWINREQQEWHLADLILCASPRTAVALQSCGVPPDKCHVLPYPVSCQTYVTDRVPRPHQPLRILFVGQVNLRKGIPYFLEMLKQLPIDSFEARVVGALQINSDKLAPYTDRCTFTGSVPRNQMRHHYAWADIFVFPSLCDSAPGTTNEALAAGLPVITTEGAGTVVEDGVSGWVVNDRDIPALVDRVQQLNGDRELLAHMSRNAVRQANKIDITAYGLQFRQTCELLLTQLLTQ